MSDGERNFRLTFDSSRRSPLVILLLVSKIGNPKRLPSDCD